MLRLALFVVVLAGHVLFVSRARAENVVLVLDGGAGAKEKATENGALATSLSRRLKERGDTVRAVVVSVRANGKPRVDEVPVPPDDALPAGFDTEATFEGRSDARVALAAALRGPALREPVTVVLIGPFGKVDPAPEGASQAIDAWNRAAPDGSQVLPFGLSEPARKTLESAKGWRASGVLVLALKDVKVETQPWSAFDIGTPLKARVDATLESVRWGVGPFAPPTFAALGTDGDAFTRGDKGGLLLTRARASGFETTVRLLVAPDSETWNVAATGTPAPVRWIPTPETRWQGGRTPTLESVQLERGQPREQRFAYRRTRPPDDFHMVTSERAPTAAVPARLRLEVEPERELELPFLVEGAIVLTAEYVGPGPLEQVIVPGQFPLARWDQFDDTLLTYFSLRSAPGRVLVRLTAPTDPRPLPPSSIDRPWALEVFRANANAPDVVKLAWLSTPPEGAEFLALHLGRGEPEETLWPANEARAVPVGAVLPLRLVGTGREPPLEGGGISLRVPDQPGLAVTVEGHGTWRTRNPRLLVEAGDVRYRADSKDSAEDQPLRLHLDADGGDGEWLAALQARTPTLGSPRGLPQTFTVTTIAPGRWEVRRTGAWSGERAHIFEDREEHVPLAFRWDERQGSVEAHVRVIVPARWGRMGWVLVALAALAALLGVFVVSSHRALPITGTLLYTVEGRAGAVGRLALAPVGRRATTVTADERGRLALGGAGSALFRLLPTRVGGMAEVPGPAGERERRLLVDGLAFSVGRHALRYVQPGGQESAPPAGESLPAVGATPAPDLLGPEYDLPHGA